MSDDKRTQPALTLARLRRALGVDAKHIDGWLKRTMSGTHGESFVIGIRVKAENYKAALAAIKQLAPEKDDGG